MSDSPPQSVSFDDRPRFRWVAPVCLGISVGAVLGIVITFAVLSGRSSSSMMVTKFDPRRVLSQITTDDLSIQDSSANIGHDSFSPDGGTSVRRRIEMTGNVRNAAEAGQIANKIKAAVDAEISRHGAYYSGGGGSSSSSSPNQNRLTAETTFYKSGGQGQIDIVFQSIDRQVNIVILIHEGR